MRPPLTPRAPSHPAPAAARCVHRLDACGLDELHAGSHSLEHLVTAGRLVLPRTTSSIHDTLLALHEHSPLASPQCFVHGDEWDTHLHLYEGTLPGTVIFLPPLGGDTTSWIPLLAELRARPHPRLVLADVPGYGRTRMLDEPVAAQYPRWARALLPTLADGPTTVVGHSMGGRLAAEAAPLLPNVSFVLFAPALPQFMNLRLRTPLRALGAATDMVAKLPDPLRLPPITLLLHAMTARPRRENHAPLTLAALGLGRSLAPTAHKSPLSEISRWLWAPGAPEIPLPPGATLALGARDWLLSPDAAARLDAAGAAPEVWAAGHLPTLEDAAAAAALVAGTFTEELATSPTLGALPEPRREAASSPASSTLAG